MDPQQQSSRQPTPPQLQQQPAAYPQPTLIPEPQMATPLPTAPATPHNKSIKMPIILMVWPVATIILTILSYALANFLMGSSPTDDGLFGETGIVKTVLNVLLFITGMLSIFLGPISFIIGLVLLIVRKTNN